MEKKVIIVTGGSRGIGKEIATSLVENGNCVILNYNKSEKEVIKIKEELIKMKKDIDIFKADVSKEDEVKKLVEYTIEKYGKIDVLINNAGISQIKMFQDITNDDWNNMLNNNLTSCFYTIKNVLPTMISKKKGLIINISSIWAQTGASCEVHYSVSKAGLDAMTKSLAKELGPSNIRVNSIAPGVIDTDMNKKLKLEDIENLKDEIPLGRIGKTSDISKCVKWLIEDEYTTGQIIPINGGWYI